MALHQVCLTYNCFEVMFLRPWKMFAVLGRFLKLWYRNWIGLVSCHQDQQAKCFSCPPNPPLTRSDTNTRIGRERDISLFVIPKISRILISNNGFSYYALKAILNVRFVLRLRFYFFFLNNNIFLFFFVQKWE